MDYVGTVTGDKRLKRVLTFLCVLGCLIIGQWRCAADPILISLPGSWPTLTAGAVTNGQVPLTLNGEASVQYIIESSPDLLNWSPVATNTDINSIREIALPAASDVTFYRASRQTIPLFTYALAAQENIDLLGNGLTASSWNSYDPNQSTNGTYNGYTGTNADFASVAGIVDPGNHTVNGSLFLGSNATYAGSSANFSGSIYADTYLVFPDVSLPNVTWLAAPGTGASHDFTTSGYYKVVDSGNIIVEPGITATLQLTTTSFNPSSLQINGGTTNSGTVVIYQIQGSFTLGGNSRGGAVGGRPQNFIYLGLPGVTNVLLTSMPTFVGVIYAPEAALFANGGTTNNFGGACIVNSIQVNGHFAFRYDESLRTNGPVR